MRRLIEFECNVFEGELSVVSDDDRRWDALSETPVVGLQRGDEVEDHHRAVAEASVRWVVEDGERRGGGGVEMEVKLRRLPVPPRERGCRACVRCIEHVLRAIA